MQASNGSGAMTEGRRRENGCGKGRWGAPTSVPMVVSTEVLIKLERGVSPDFIFEKPYKQIQPQSYLRNMLLLLIELYRFVLLDITHEGSIETPSCFSTWQLKRKRPQNFLIVYNVDIYQSP